MERFLACLVASAALLFAGCGRDAVPDGAAAPAPMAAASPAAAAPSVSSVPSGTAGAAPARLGQCAACHGRDGRSTIANVPDLAGRDAGELLDAMAAYLDGRRDYPPMRAMLGPVRPADREALARWYAAQAPVPAP